MTPRPRLLLHAFGVRTVPAILMSATLLAAPAAVAQVAPTVRAPADSFVLAPAGTRGAGPNGATLRCADGSHPAPNAPESACADKGGVSARYPLLPIPGPPPGAQRAAARRAAMDSARREAARAQQQLRAPPPRPAARPGPPPRFELPVDATLLCNDGTVIRADTVAVRCAAHGGLKGRFAPRPRP